MRIKMEMFGKKVIFVALSIILAGPSSVATIHDEIVLENGLKYMCGALTAVGVNVTSTEGNYYKIKTALTTDTATHNLDNIDNLASGIGYKNIAEDLFTAIAGNSGLLTTKLNTLSLPMGGIAYDLSADAVKAGFVAHVSNLIKADKGQVVANSIYERIINCGKKLSEVDTAISNTTTYTSLAGLIPAAFRVGITDITLIQYKYVFSSMLESLCNAVSPYSSGGYQTRGVELIRYIHMGLSNAADTAVLGKTNISLAARTVPEAPVRLVGRLTEINECFNEFLTAAFCGAITTAAPLATIVKAAMEGLLAANTSVTRNSALSNYIKNQLPSCLADYYPTFTS